MVLFLDDMSISYELTLLMNTFLPLEKQRDVQVEDIQFFSNNFSGSYIYLKKNNDNSQIEGKYHDSKGEVFEVTEKIKNDSQRKNDYKRVLFQLLRTQYLSVSHPWGILTGIRPVKIVHDLFERGFTKIEINNFLKKEYCISDEKSSLALDVAMIQREHFDRLDSEIAIYINIPFCPSRCSYCSFFSTEMKGKEATILADQYLDALEKEMSNIMGDKTIQKIPISSVYIGGGTPSCLSLTQIQRLLTMITKNIIFKENTEFTFEAGRVDTLDEKKLTLIKSFDVTRISINPQTMNDDTLKKIGRNHTSVEVKECFRLARRIGFDNINMDIILGLEDENQNHINNTLEQISELKPDSMTVHTLSIKRASQLKAELEDKVKELNSEDINSLMKLSQSYAKRMNMLPYYLYRQKNMLLNLENTGYALKGKVSLYNIGMMEERQTILAFGSGSISKFIYPRENRIERVANTKDVRSYIKKIDEVIEKKRIEMKSWEQKYTFK